jgi:predicted nuclease of predicted toxin-antitoxin system
MNFLVDAHLPPALCGLLRAAGHDARHTSELADRNRTSDGVLNELSVRERRVVITKDADFYHSHLLHGKPWKLLLIRTGNLRARDLQRLFAAHLPAILGALEQNSLVELDHEEVRVVG